MDLPKGETIKLITGVNGLLHTPSIVEGEISSTGKTIAVEHTSGKTYRLDTEKILSGGLETRKGAYYKLYSKDEMISSCNANLQRGPVAGANSVPNRDELPEATHQQRN